MSDEYKKIQIVLASPSDLKEEREMICDTIDKINKVSARRGLYFDLRRWEDASPGANDKGAQGLIDINLEIPKADIFICMYWEKIGTILENEGVAGTEHELNIALDSYKKGHKPDIMVFFKEPTNKKNKDVEYIQQIAERIKPIVLYNQFNSVEDLQIEIQDILQKKIFEMKPTSSEAFPIDGIIEKVSSTEQIVNKLNSNTMLFVNEGFYGILDFQCENTFVKKEEVFDGTELVIEEIENFGIIGNNAKILTQPRYASVITFRNCNNIKLDGLILGHTPDAGYCTGPVLKFEDCENVQLENLSLFGCGTYGIEATNCKKIRVNGSRIFRCTYGGVLVNSTEISIENTMIYNCNDVFSIIEGNNSDLLLNNVAITKNTVNGPIIKMDGSYIYCQCVSVDNCSYEEISNINIPFGITVVEN